MPLPQMSVDTDWLESVSARKVEQWQSKSQTASSGQGSQTSHSSPVSRKPFPQKGPVEEKEAVEKVKEEAEEAGAREEAEKAREEAMLEADSGKAHTQRVEQKPGEGQGIPDSHCSPGSSTLFPHAGVYPGTAEDAWEENRTEEDAEATTQRQRNKSQLKPEGQGILRSHSSIPSLRPLPQYG